MHKVRTTWTATSQERKAGLVSSMALEGLMLPSNGSAQPCYMVPIYLAPSPPNVMTVPPHGGRGGHTTVALTLQQFLYDPKKNSIAFSKSTSQRIYREQHTPKIGWKLHKYRLKHALHTLDGHFR